MVKILLYIFTALNLFLYFYITVLVGSKWKISKAHQRFFFFAFFSFLWILDTLFENILVNVHFYEIIVHLNFSLASLVAISMTSFAINFSNKTKSNLVEYCLIAPGIIVSLLAFSNLFVSVIDLRMINTQKVGYFFYICFLIIYFVILPTIIFFRKLIRTQGIIKKQIQYILFFYLFGITILLIQSIYTNIKGVLSSNTDLLLTNTSIIFSAMIAYFILRYRFMDVRIIIRKGLINAFSLIITLALYTYIVLLFKSSIENYWNVNSTWTAIILIVLVALGFPLLKSLIEKAVDVLFKGRKSIDLAVKELQDQISRKTDLEALIDVIVREVKKYLFIDYAKFFVLNNKDNWFEWHDSESYERIEMNNDLVRYFEKYSHALVCDEISHRIDETEGKFDKEILQKVEKEMKKRHAGLALPYKTEEGLYAIVFLGNREGATPYSVQDIEYLEQMREQVNFTLASAVLYRNAMERIKFQSGQTI